MPTNKPRVNVTISKAHHALAKALAERDSRTIALLVEYLLRRYAEERGWSDLLPAGSVPAAPPPGVGTSPDRHGS